MYTGLPLDLGIAGCCFYAHYEDSRDGERRKNASSAIENYWVRLKEDSVKTLGGAKADYHIDGLKCVVEASLKLCDVWGSSSDRNNDIGCLFSSLCTLGKQQFLTESTLKLYWGFEGIDEMGVNEVVENFANLNIMRRE